MPAPKTKTPNASNKDYTKQLDFKEMHRLLADDGCIDYDFRAGAIPSDDEIGIILNSEKRLILTPDGKWLLELM